MQENTNYDVKRAVLKAVYEENLGISRSFRGKRHRPNDAPPARRVELLAPAGSIVLVCTLTLIVLLGLSRQAGVTSAEPQVTQVAAAQPQPTAAPAARPPGSPGAGREPLPISADPEVAAQRISVAGASRYAEMLSHLDVPVADLFDLHAQTIVIDPGHGGRDPGAVGHQGLTEKDVTLDIARRLRTKLLAAGYRVVLTRDSDSKIDLQDRVSFAKEQHADLFISLHVNSVPEEAGPLNYVETYYFGPHTDRRTLALAREENRGSDYTMGAFRELIARIGDTVKTEESAQLAGAIHENLFTNLKRHSDDLLDAGTKSGPFVVLLGVEVPSVLVEISCISNEEEAIRLSTPQYRDDVAGYLETGIIEYMEERNGSDRSNGVIARDVTKQQG